jgi:hypothetical protein
MYLNDIECYQKHFAGRTIYLPRRIKPKYEKRKLKDCDSLVECVVVEISGDEYEMCEDMKITHKKDEYGKGLCNTKKDKHGAERAGKLGELAFAKMFGLPVDMSNREAAVDFVFLGKTIDSKTAKSDYGANCIRIQNEYGGFRELKSDYYIAGFVEKDDRNAKEAAVVLVGYQDRDSLIKSGVKPARVGKHKNVEMSFSHVRNLRGLLDELE